MDAVVQLIRNALCCVKDLTLFGDTIFHDNNYTTSNIYEFPSPYLNQTTPLELCISISQLYACISCTKGGIKLITSGGIGKLQRLVRITDIFKSTTEDNKKSKESDNKISGIVENIVRSSLVEEANDATMSVLLGVCLLSTGISFFWLFANSLHITPTGWIGGLPALIHALIVMEVALVVFLYSMFTDGTAAFKKSTRIHTLIQDEKVSGDNGSLSLENYTLLCDESSWTPFWTKGASSNIEKDAEEKMFQKELEAIKQNTNSMIADKNIIKDQQVVSRLIDYAQRTKWNGFLQFIYFILNLIAFYGYLLGIVVYYFDDEDNQPSYVSALMFGYSNDTADWAGNFAGDLMWTIEPIIILASPMIMSWSKKTRSKKEKKD